MRIFKALGIIINLCFVLLLNGARATSNTSSGPDCVVWVPDATQYVWVYLGYTPTAKATTNSAGTRVEILDVTTGGFQTEGKWIHLTTKTTLAFPTNFRAGAAGYNWASGGFKTGSMSFFGYFSTVYSLPQEPPQTVTYEADGIVYGLNVITSNLESISRFQTLYPEIRQFQTCTASSHFFNALLPPGVLNVAPGAATPTVPSPGSSSDMVAAPTPTESSSAPALTTVLSATLVSTSSDSRIPERPSEAADRSASDTLSLSRSQSPSGVPVSTFPAPAIRSSTTTPSSTPPASSTLQTTAASPEISSTSSSNLPKSPEIPQVSVVSGTVLVDGHDLGFNTTLTLGSGSLVTVVALKTNSFGQTVVVGGELTQAQAEKSQSSHSVIRSTSLRPSPSPAPVVSVSSVSSTPSSGATSKSSHLAPLVQFWTAIWIAQLARWQIFKAST